VADELEVIRDQMEETRSSLANKLEALESQVRETVQNATETVNSAVEGAKEVVTSVSEGTKQVVETVTETVESVKEKLSVSRAVEEHPWVSVGAAVATGFVLAQVVPRRRQYSWPAQEELPAAGGYMTSGVSAAAQPARAAERGALTGALEGVLGSAAGTLGRLAVGTLMSVVKDLVKTNLPPEWQGELNRIVDDATTRLGGKVMETNPLHGLFEQPHPQEHQSSCPPIDEGGRI